MPRPKGRETHVIITTYDLPRPEAMPHDAITTPDGHAWYSDFGHQYIGELDPKTGKVTDYQFPILKHREPKGFLELEADAEGNVWGAGMYQGMLGKVDAKTKKRWSTKSRRNGNPTARSSPWCRRNSPTSTARSGPTTRMTIRCCVSM
jgi:streptogramin lyase